MEKSFDYYKHLIDEHILDFLPNIDGKSITLYEAMKYSLSSPGKRIRPVLLLSVCEFAGGDIRKALPYACALEYIHTYSLIHDDLPAMDNDDLRRGVPTNHKVYGEAQAILAGDGLLTSAFEAMYKDMFMCLDDQKELQKRINAAYIIAKNAGCKGMVAGQLADIEAENKVCSSEMLDYIHTNKTGALITASVQAGLYLAGADDETFKKFTEFSQCLGLAYQIHDDILDATVSTEELGKPSGSDEESNKSTYVTMYGLEASQEKLDSLIKRAHNALHDYYDNAEFFTKLIDQLAKRTN